MHVPDRLDTDRRRALLDACRDRAGPGGPAHGRPCASGRHDDRPSGLPGPVLEPEDLRGTLGDRDGGPVRAFPARLREPRPRAVTDAQGPAVVGGLSYDIAPVNFRAADAHMGTHRDADEKSPAPVVSPSPGDTCVFRFGHMESRGKAVPKVYPGTEPADLARSGRLNITL
ncbi:alpha-ketoglutarate-dependent dioxygenase AlkB [Streptomyces fuscichromogenes]|uniref:alpha-ketoglutarate-dependent dioxygenase AlkB n=1 Tax=Streptomyces fuscichromogenes TaxID=1324013 RepID=UPI00382886EE